MNMLSVGLSKFGSYRRPLAALALLLSLRTLLIELVLRELAGEPVNIIIKIIAHYDLMKYIMSHTLTTKELHCYI